MLGQVLRAGLSAEPAPEGLLAIAASNRQGALRLHGSAARRPWSGRCGVPLPSAQGALPELRSCDHGLAHPRLGLCPTPSPQGTRELIVHVPLGFYFGSFSHAASQASGLTRATTL